MKEEAWIDLLPPAGREWREAYDRIKAAMDTAAGSGIDSDIVADAAMAALVGFLVDQHHLESEVVRRIEVLLSEYQELQGQGGFGGVIDEDV
jgi:hypothetical protein